MTRGLTRGEAVSSALAAALAVATAAAAVGGAPNTLQFVLGALALLVLAWVVGVGTEQLGESAGPRVGGVLNATFGNAAELIITIFAVRAGEIDVARASITGSILGNTLLVLGAAMLLGGLKNGMQTFDRTLAGMNASMLALAVIGLGIPTAFAAAAPSNVNVQAVSDVTAGHPARLLRALADLHVPAADGCSRRPARAFSTAPHAGNRGGDVARLDAGRYRRCRGLRRHTRWHHLDVRAFRRPFLVS